MGASIIYKPGDVFLTKGHRLISYLIRYFTQDKGESITRVNHVGLVVSEGSNPYIVEALHTVKRHRLSDAYGGTPTQIAVYRPRALSDLQRHVLVENVEKEVGKRYGYLKIAAIFLDYFLRSRKFRRLIGLTNSPFCSLLVATQLSRFLIYFQGAPRPEEITPDDIDDTVTSEPENWDRIKALGPLDG